MPSPFTPLKTSPSANKNNSSGILANDFAMFFVKQNAQSQVTSATLRGKQVMALKSGDMLLLHWESHCSEEKKNPNCSDHKNEVWSEECAATCQLSMACGAGQDGSSAPARRLEKAQSTRSSHLLPFQTAWQALESVWIRISWRNTKKGHQGPSPWTCPFKCYL